MATFEAKSYKAVAVDATDRVIHRVSKAEDFSLTSTDTIKFFKLPPGAKILNGGIFGEDLDTSTGATAELQVTDGTTTYKLLDAVNVQADFAYDAKVDTALYVAWLGKVTDDDDWYVALVLDAAPTTPIADTNIQCYIEYTMDTEAGELPF